MEVLRRWKEYFADILSKNIMNIDKNTEYKPEPENISDL